MVDLDEIARGYDPSSAGCFDQTLIRWRIEAIVPRLRGSLVCELGCATGASTARLAAYAARLVVVEAAAANIAAARVSAPSATYWHGRVEDYAPTGRAFTDIVACNLLEHLDDPARELARWATWLEPDGRLHVTVPNGRSLHRRIGVALGVLDTPCTLTDADRAQGHRRNFTDNVLCDMLWSAGWNVEHLQGIGLKPFPNAQMVAVPSAWLDAANRLAAQDLEGMAAELYVCATPR